MKNRTPKFLTIFISIILLLGGGYLVLQKYFVQKQIPQSTKNLTVALLDQPAYALIYIAQNKGYFKEQGLHVTFNKNFTRGIECLADALKGNSDIALAFETPVVRKIYDGESLRIISTMHTSTKNTAVVGRKDKGIITANDLKGKKIGVTKNSAIEFYLYSYLVSQGIKLSDVTFVDGDLKSMASLLKSGDVDAVAAGNPFLYDVQKEFSPEAISFFQSEVYTENSLLAGREDIVKDKKEAITRFLTALVKAENLYKTDNQEALNAVIAELPNVSEETIRGTWDKYTPGLKLDNVLLTLLNREGQWFKDNGIYKTELPNFRNAIFIDYLKSVKPEGVTLY